MCIVILISIDLTISLEDFKAIKASMLVRGALKTNNENKSH